VGLGRVLRRLRAPRAAAIALAAALFVPAAPAAADHPSAWPAPAASEDGLAAGARLLAQGRHAAARAAFAGWLARQAGPEARQAVADAYLAEGQLGAAIRVLQGSADPEAAALREALALVLEGARDRAVPALAAAARVRPSASLQLVLGELLEAVGRTAEAVEAYREATRLAPADPRPWVHLGAAYEAAGQCWRAVEAYGHAAELRPDARAWTALGRVYQQQRHYKSAVHAYRQAVALRPHDLDALAGLLLAYAGDRNWAAGLETYHVMRALDRPGAEEAFALAFGQPKR